MRDRVLKIVSQVLNVPVEQLDDESSPDTVEDWDSLKHMNLVLALEEEFGVTFSDGEVVELLRIRRIVEIVEKKMPKTQVGGRSV